jgi:hypothetical protein
MDPSRPIHQCDRAQQISAGCAAACSHVAEVSVGCLRPEEVLSLGEELGWALTGVGVNRVQRHCGPPNDVHCAGARQAEALRIVKNVC